MIFFAARGEGGEKNNTPETPVRLDNVEITMGAVRWGGEGAERINLGWGTRLGASGARA